MIQNMLQACAPLKLSRATGALANIIQQMSQPIELVISIKPVSPVDLLASLSRSAEELGVTSRDVYGDFPLNAQKSWLRRFEAEVATFCGTESGIFLPSGCMSQGVMLKVAEENSIEKSNTFICHHSSHILLHENDTCSSLLKMRPIVVTGILGTPGQQPMMYTDVSLLLDAPEKPACLVVECPHREIGGKCTPFEELRKMSEHCRRNGIHFHMDGARVWEASGHYTEPLSELIGLFDSVYASFYKGLGGITGAMLLGSDSFVKQAQVWSRRFGGNVYSIMPFAVSCWAGFRAHKNSFVTLKEHMQKIVARLTSELSKWDAQRAEAGVPGLSGLVVFDPPVPQVSLIHVYARGTLEQVMQCKETARNKCGLSCFIRMRPAADGWCYTEFNMGPLNMSYDEDMWVTAWQAYVEDLVTLLTASAPPLPPVDSI